MKSINLTSAVFLIIAWTSNSVLADGQHHRCSMCGAYVCVLDVSQKTEKVTCFDVEEKAICIPGIKLPWSCKRRCGKVRIVRVVKEVPAEKIVCKYEWSAQPVCNACRQKQYQRSNHCVQVPRESQAPPAPAASLTPASPVAIAASAQPTINPVPQESMPTQGTSNAVQRAEPIRLD